MLSRILLGLIAMSTDTQQQLTFERIESINFRCRSLVGSIGHIAKPAFTRLSR